MKKSYPPWIDEYADAFYSSLQNHDTRVHMPFNGWNFYPLFGEHFVEKVHEAVVRLEEKGLKVSDVAHKLPIHASMKFKYPELVLSFKSAKTRPHVVRKVSDFFVEAVRHRATEDGLWLNNRLKEHDGVRLAREKKFAHGSREHASEVGKIITGCATLGHGLYNDFCVDLTYDVYGPYDVSELYGKGSELIIRSFPDLAPKDLWKGKKFPFRSITVYTVFKKMNARPMYVPCQLVYEKSTRNQFTHFQVEIDGEFATDLAELKVIRDKLLKYASELYVEYQSFGFERHKEFWLWQLCYQLKPLFDVAGVDWKPSKEMVEAVRGRELVPILQKYQIPRKEFYKKMGIDYLKAAYGT